MRRDINRFRHAIAMVLAMSLPQAAFAFSSGSTGADGAFNPTVNTQLQLPPDGIFNFTSVSIPTGVTVTFKKNTTNTPVVILATGNVTITGTIDVSGTRATDVGAAGDGNLGDDGVPGLGGPGGYDGGRGGTAGTTPGNGGNGLGPGGGGSGPFGPNFNCAGNGQPVGGGGAGFGDVGGATVGQGTGGGVAYGTSQLLPLIGGSGGGGGSGWTGFSGSGGGGGGGAILIAASGTLNITGAIQANGNASGVSSGQNSGATGGGGSGGGIRLLATTISGNGTLNAVGSGANGSTVSFCYNGGSGSFGRIRLEAEAITRTAASNPVFPQVTAPTTVFIAGLPTLRITSVAGVSAPAAPTGNADITLPSTTSNPVTVTFATTGVPVGNTVKLTVVPAAAAAVSVVSPALSGTTDSATASVSVSLPGGPSVLQATTTYTIVASLGNALSQFAMGERVEKITLSATLNGPSMITLTTISGKQYTIPAKVAAGILAG